MQADLLIETNRQFSIVTKTAIRAPTLVHVPPSAIDNLRVCRKMSFLDETSRIQVEMKIIVTQRTNTIRGINEDAVRKQVDRPVSQHKAVYGQVG